LWVLFSLILVLFTLFVIIYLGKARGRHHAGFLLSVFYFRFAVYLSSQALCDARQTIAVRDPRILLELAGREGAWPT